MVSKKKFFIHLQADVLCYLLVNAKAVFLATDRCILLIWSQQHESKSYCHIWPVKEGYKHGLNHTGEENLI